MILVTGCNGLLGSFIARTLLDRGYNVKGYIRDTADLNLLTREEQSSITWVEGSLFDSYALSKALEGVSKVIHTAAVVSFSPSRVKEMYKVNVQGTANLINESLASGVNDFIHVSSVAALGRPRGKEKINEEDLWIESDYNTHYARSKYLAELEVYRGFEEGLHGFVLNPSVILSPGDIHKSSSRLFGYVLKGGRYYSKGTLNYVDVRDVCALLLLLMESNVSTGEKFVMNAGSIAYEHFFQRVAGQFGLNAPNKEAGKFMKELLWRIEYVRSWMSGSEPLITKETARLSGAGHEFDSQKIKQLFNYQFHSIDDTVAWVCHELRQNPAVYNLLQKDR
jgi:dihydroflavonol-4-reductase